MLKFRNFIQEGVDDPAIFKAIFLAGGPGSGKSFIVGKTGLPALGMKVVNSDDAFETAMKKAGKKMTSDEIFSDEGQTIRDRSKRLTAKKQEMYISGRLGLVIDGTGKDPNKIKKQAKALQDLGYDTMMILVNTTLEVAIDREPDNALAKKWIKQEREKKKRT